MKYAITGATGKYGQAAIKELLELTDANNIIALARNVEKGQKLLPAGVEVRPGDYNDEAQLEKSLQGVDRLLLVSSLPGQAVDRLEQHQNVLKAAKASGVKFIAYTSFPAADQSSEDFVQDHKDTETAIINSGLDYALLRDNWYLGNETSTIVAASKGEPFVYAAGRAKIGWTNEKYYAIAGAKVLYHSDKKIYELGGKLHTYAELADAVKEVTGADFKVISLTPAEYQQQLIKSGMGEDLAAVITSFQSLIRTDALDVEGTDLEKVLGYPLPSLAESVKEILK